jgi:hypothetical protein
MQDLSILFAYFGPETLMPMTSVVATIAAFVMMFGKSIFRHTVGWIRMARSRMHRGHRVPAPHFAVGLRRARRRISRVLVRSGASEVKSR